MSDHKLLIGLVFMFAGIIVFMISVFYEDDSEDKE